MEIIKLNGKYFELQEKNIHNTDDIDYNYDRLKEDCDNYEGFIVLLLLIITILSFTLFFKR